MIPTIQSNNGCKIDKLKLKNKKNQTHFILLNSFLRGPSDLSTLPQMLF